jgi:hypothetical protein
MTGPIVLVLIGALLEAVGIVLIAYEILSDRRRALKLAQEKFLWGQHGKVPKIPGRVPTGFGTPQGIEDELYKRDEILAKIIESGLSGDVRLRVVGVAMLLLGLATATAGNVWGYA